LKFRLSFIFEFFRYTELKVNYINLGLI